MRGRPARGLVSNFEIMSYLQGQGVENAEPIMKGGSAQVGGIKVTATHAFHGSSIALEDGSMIYGGEPLGYVVEFESGFKLYHAGDTALFGDMQLIGELYSPDLALLPIGDRLTMGPFEAAHAARLLGVDHVVPMHYSPDVMPYLHRHAGEVPGAPRRDRTQRHRSRDGTRRRPVIVKCRGGSRAAHKLRATPSPRSRRAPRRGIASPVAPTTSPPMPSKALAAMRREIKATSGAASTASGARVPIGKRKGSGTSNASATP